MNCAFAAAACGNAVFALALVLSRRKIVFADFSLDRPLEPRDYGDIEAARAQFQDNLDAILNTNEDFVRESIRLREACGCRGDSGGYENAFQVFLDLGPECGA